MKEKLTKNAGLKLISLLCAFLVWLAVVNVANPVQTKNVEVPVTITNESVLESANLTYKIEGKDTVTVQISARARDIYRFGSDDFKAYADLSDLYSVTGAVPVTVEVLKDEEYLVGNAAFAGAKYEVKAPGVVHIETEELQTKRFTLKPNVTGTPAGSGEYAPGEISLTPDYVYVRGPVSLVGQINSVGIEISVEGASSDLSGTAEPKYYDANGNLLELGDSVSTLGGGISYELTMLKVKNLALDFQVSGEVAEGYRMTGIECSVTSVPVAGLRSVLANMNTLPVQSPELFVEGATQDKECRIDLEEFLPPGTELAGMGDSVVSVTLKVEPLQTKTYIIDETDIVMKGMKEEYSYELSGSASVTVRGLKEDLDSLSSDKMNLTLDVTGQKPGTYTGVLRYQLDDAFEVVGTPAVSVDIIEEEAFLPSQPEESSEAGKDAEQPEESGGSDEKEAVSDSVKQQSGTGDKEPLKESGEKIQD